MRITAVETPEMEQWLCRKSVLKKHFFIFSEVVFCWIKTLEQSRQTAFPRSSGLFVIISYLARFLSAEIVSPPANVSREECVCVDNGGVKMEPCDKTGCGWRSPEALVSRRQECGAVRIPPSIMETCDAHIKPISHVLLTWRGAYQRLMFYQPAGSLYRWRDS